MGGNLPEILPPENNRSVQIWWWRVQPQTARGIKLAAAVPALGCAAWLLQNFLQLRGVVNLTASRIDLAFLVLCMLFVAYLVTMGSPRLRKWRPVLFLVIILLGFAVDWITPKPQLTTIPLGEIYQRPAEWRVIKDWQKAELAPVLEQFPNSILRIVVTSSAPDETLDYANQFKDFFGKHKWNVIGPETAATDQIVQNIQLSINEQYVGKPPEAFASVESQMRFDGFRLRSAVFVLDPLVPPNEMVMWVGPETPLGFPEHVPLILGEACQHPLQFTDDTMHFFGAGGKDFVRWVRIKPPANSQFSAGQKVLVVLTKSAKSVATSEQFRVQALGTLMPRPDTLDVTVAKDLNAGELLDMKIISDEESRVKCVVDRSSK